MVYFVWYKYSSSCSLLVSICIKYISPFFILSLYVLFNLKWACYKQHIVGSFFFPIQPLWLLTGEFNLFTNRGLLIGKNLLMQSYSLFYGSFEVPSFLSSSLVTFLCGLVIFFVLVCFDLLLFIFCESTVGFCFVATKRLNIKHLIDRTVFYDYSHITTIIAYINYPFTTLLMFLTIYLFLYCVFIHIIVAIVIF